LNYVFFPVRVESEVGSLLEGFGIAMLGGYLGMMMFMSRTLWLMMIYNDIGL